MDCSLIRYLETNEHLNRMEEPLKDARGGGEHNDVSLAAEGGFTFCILTSL